jgi:hypothetical protein
MKARSSAGRHIRGLNAWRAKSKVSIGREGKMLNGREFVAENPLTADPDDSSTTGSGSIPSGFVAPAATPSTPQQSAATGASRNSPRYVPFLR